jgi:DDE superfamily endonuclease
MKGIKKEFKNQGKTFDISSTISNFFNEFHLGTCLNRSGISKVRGFSPTMLLHDIFYLPFLHKNLFQGIVRNPAICYSKDVAYDFLKNPRYNWRKLLLLFSIKVSGYFSGLTGKRRENVLIIDDTLWDRSRSKSVELLARVFDHCTHTYRKGFRILSLGWSDGASFVPLDFALLSSAKEKNRLQGITKILDKRTCGYKRRKEAMQPSTELLEPMIKRALSLGVKAQYILMDSWFGFPKIIKTLSAFLPVICMLKRMPRVFYCYKGRKLNLIGLYQCLKKRRGKARILASVTVTMSHGQKAKIVFIRDKRKKEWLALLSTDVDLPDKEIIRIYGKRWDIEVFFKMAKQHMCLANSVLIRDFDGLVAHTTISMLRYVFIAFEKRIYDDPRTFGELFLAYCDEIKDLSLWDALKKMLALLEDLIQHSHSCSHCIIDGFIKEILSTFDRFFIDTRPLAT